MSEERHVWRAWSSYPTLGEGEEPTWAYSIKSQLHTPRWKYDLVTWNDGFIFIDRPNRRHMLGDEETTLKLMMLAMAAEARNAN